MSSRRSNASRPAARLLARHTSPAPWVWMTWVLALATLAVFWPVGHFDFTLYDDRAYVVDNPHVNQGLSWPSVRWALTTTYFSYWHPLTWMSHMLDCEWFGLHPGAHHWVSALLHAANAVLLFLVLRRCTGAGGPSAWVAALFALHPLHVESVAWIAARKDVLSTLFWILTLCAYAAWAQRPALGRYCLTLGTYALGLMSKPMLVTLPCVLLLLDVWPLRRLQLFQTSGAVAWRTAASQIGARLFEKMPFFLLAAGSSAITYLGVERAGNMLAAESLPWSLRLANVPVSFMRYLGMMIFPEGLAVFYPFPERYELGAWLGATLAVLALTGAALRWAPSRPYLAVGWFWFLGTLVPTLGIVAVGNQALADRYTYVSLIGLWIALAWGVSDLVARRPKLAPLMRAGAVATVLVCALLTSRQLSFWRDTETLFTRALAVTTRNTVAHINLGNALLDSGRTNEARTHFEAVLRLESDNAFAIGSLGNIAFGAGRSEEAIALYEQALRSAPNNPELHNNLAASLSQMGRHAEAALQSEAALRVRPDSPSARLGYASTLLALGRSAEAESNLLVALQLSPELAPARFNLGNLRRIQGRWREAETQFRHALRLRPQHLESRVQLAIVLAQQGRHDEALRLFSETVSLHPASTEARLYLAEMLERTGRTEEAIRQYDEVVRLEPDSIPGLSKLAWLRATHPEDRFRDGASAVRLAERARELTQQNPASAWGTLAAAYAEAGRFADAVRAAEQARDLANAAGQTNLARFNQTLLGYYSSGRAYRQPPPAGATDASRPLPPAPSP